MNQGEIVFPLQQQAEEKHKWDNLLPLQCDSWAKNTYDQCSTHLDSDALVNSASVMTRKNSTLEIFFLMVNHMVFKNNLFFSE